MKKSELFKKIYQTVFEVQNTIGTAYDSETIESEMKDEEIDLEMPENSMAFVCTALEWYSARLNRVLATSLTEMLSDFLKIENDVNLFNPEVVENLIPEE